MKIEATCQACGGALWTGDEALSRIAPPPPNVKESDPIVYEHYHIGCARRLGLLPPPVGNP